MDESKPKEILVFSTAPSTCKRAGCGQHLHKNAVLKIEKEQPSCLEWADLDDLVYLGRAPATHIEQIAVPIVRGSRRVGGHQQCHTNYDELWMQAYEGIDARDMIRDQPEHVLDHWRQPR